MNNLAITPSRKANCVRHPLLSIKATNKIPNITVKFGSAKETLFSSDDYKTTIDSKEMTIQEIFDEIVEKFDQSSVLL